jgi:hypothetical protein
MAGHIQRSTNRASGEGKQLPIFKTTTPHIVSMPASPYSITLNPSSRSVRWLPSKRLMNDSATHAHRIATANRPPNFMKEISFMENLS